MGMMVFKIFRRVVVGYSMVPREAFATADKLVVVGWGLEMVDILVLTDERGQFAARLEVIPPRRS